MADGATGRPVVMAAIAGAHGVTGEVRLKIFARSAEDLGRYRRFQLGQTGARELTLKSVREGARGIIARFAEIADRTAAEALRGELLCLDRASLPPLGPGEYYWHDLLGLPVVDERGQVAGEVIAVENYGATDLLEIRLPDGRQILVPLIAEAVPQLDEQRATVLRSYLDAG